MRIPSTFLKIAFNNLVRNKRRCVFILVTLVLSILLTTWIMAFFEGMNHQIAKAVQDSNLGTFQYISPEFAETHEVYDYFSLSKLKKKNIPYQYSPEFVLEGTINSIYGNSKAILIGIEPESHNRLFPLKKHIKQGQYQEIFQNKIIIGKALAKRNSLKIDSSVLFHFQTRDGQLRSESLVVGGIFDFNGKSFGEKFIYIHHQYLTKLFFGEKKDAYHRLIFFKKEKEGRRLQNKLKPLIYKTWKDLNPEMNVVTSFHGGIVNFILCVTALAVYMIILTPITILWNERIPEMKVLKTLGLTKKQLWTLSMSEAIILSFIAIAISLVLTSLLIAYSAKIGVDFSYLIQGKELSRAGIDLPTHVFPRFHYSQYLYSVSYIFIAIILSYFISTKNVSRKLKRVFN